MSRFQEETRNSLQQPRKPGSVEGGQLRQWRGEGVWVPDPSGDGVSVYPLLLPPTAAESLAPGESATVVMGINFCDSTQAANFQLWYVSSLWRSGRAAGKRRGQNKRTGGGVRWGGIMIWKASQDLGPYLQTQCVVRGEKPA